MGTIRDRKGKVLIEEEKIKKRWKEYTEKLYKKKLNDLDNHDGLVTHPEPDFLECEVKWALGHTAVNKVNGGDGIPAELFKILKKVKVAQLCPTLCDPMDYTVHEILQARILEWLADPSSRESFQPRNLSQISLIAGGFFTNWAIREALKS